MKMIPKNELLNDTQIRWSIERGLQLVCETVFDIGSHILVGSFDLSPPNYQDVINMLREKGVISEDLGKKFKGLGGFRNILVHDYLEINSEEIYNKLQNRLGDFDQFVKEVVTYITS